MEMQLQCNTVRIRYTQCVECVIRAYPEWICVKREKRLTHTRTHTHRKSERQCVSRLYAATPSELSIL
jgi:hypothetical protein